MVKCGLLACLLAMQVLLFPMSVFFDGATAESNTAYVVSQNYRHLASPPSTQRVLLLISRYQVTRSRRWGTLRAVMRGRRRWESGRSRRYGTEERNVGRQDRDLWCGGVTFIGLGDKTDNRACAQTQ